MISKEDRAYCAGLYEGEGSIGCQVTTNLNNRIHRNLRLVIGMKDREPLELFEDIMGVGNLKGPYTNGGNMYTYSVTRFEHVQFVVCQMWFWLSPRRKQQIEMALKKFHSITLINKPRKSKETVFK